VFFTGALEMGADNGLRAMNSPGFGFETELSGESVIERVRVVSRVETKGQTGSIDPVMVASHRCGRAKGRSEFPAPAEYRSEGCVCCIDPLCAEKRRRRAAGAEIRLFPPRIERRVWKRSFSLTGRCRS